VTAVEELRRAGHDGGIVLIGDEAIGPYARPPLSKAVTTGRDEPETALLPLLDDADLTVVLGDGATGVDVDDSVVHLASGRTVPFDGLVIATGARARTLADVGGNPYRVPEHVLRSLSDAVRLRDELTFAERLVIVGGGILGMEIASAAVDLGVRVTVLTNEAPLLAQCGPLVSEVVVRQAAARGVEIVVDPAGASIGDHGGHPFALAGGRTFDADVIVTAIGDVPNVEWLAGSGLPARGALRVDTRCRVSARIVGIGDVAAVGRAGARYPHWSTAIDQAGVAARALLAGDDADEFVPRPYFWTDQFGLALKMTGHAPFLGEPVVLAGSIDDLDALVQWNDETGPTAALAINRRIAVAKLHQVGGNPLAVSR
jgi:NADPH-dependent 2,4-dienoyl-CoA reductase/sulfur reductase-like enzyme